MWYSHDIIKACVTCDQSKLLLDVKVLIYQHFISNTWRSIWRGAIFFLLIFIFDTYLFIFLKGTKIILQTNFFNPSDICIIYLDYKIFWASKICAIYRNFAEEKSIDINIRQYKDHKYLRKVIKHSFMIKHS